jgi:hypothetical protein
VTAFGVHLLGDVDRHLTRDRATSCPGPQLVPPPIATVGMVNFSVRASLSATS